MSDQLARPFSHLDAPNAGLYRGVMGAFVAAKRRFLVHLRPEDVAESLREAVADEGGPQLDGAAVEAALKQLEQWGNLRADPDTSRVTTVDDFYRTRYLYQLSAEGEAAELALAAYDEALGNRGELQSVALEDIRVRLRSLRQQAGLPDPDPAVVHSLLRELSTLLDGLAANATAFMGSLQRTIDLQDVDEDAFIAYKDRLIGYLERFVGDLVVKSAEIVTTLRDLESQPDHLGVEGLLALAAAREAADAAPDQREADEALQAKLDGWRARWSGLCSWFLGDRAHPSQAALLRQRARAAIPALLAAVTTLQERRTGRSDRSADFRALARWFAEAPSDAEAHRLWRAAFGLTSARHLGIDAGTLEAREEQPAPAATAWAEAPPVTISPRLRATGRHQHRGTLARIVDRSQARQRLEEMLAAERSQTEAARRRLATGRPTRLSDLGPLDRDEFELFLGLLGDALAGGPPGPDGIRTTTSDGTLEITLLPTGDGASAEIATPDGVFHGPDHVLTIVDLTHPAAAGTPRLVTTGGER
ncbi:MAG TPA: TIGR02677 family protein [Actinomycetes bacterium]